MGHMMNGMKRNSGIVNLPRKKLKSKRQKEFKKKCKGTAFNYNNKLEYLTFNAYLTYHFHGDGSSTHVYLNRQLIRTLQFNSHKSNN